MTSTAIPAIPSSRSFDAFRSEPVARLGGNPFPFLTLMSIGALFWLPFNLIGTMYAIEPVLALIGVAGLLFCLEDASFAPSAFQRFFALLAVSICAYVVSDLIHATPMHDALRAWARTGFLALDSLGLWVLCRRSMANLLPLFLGILAGYLIFEFRVFGWFFIYWKFGLGVALTAALLSAIALFVGARAVLFTGLLTGFFALLSFLLDSRALGGVMALTSAFVLMKVFVPRRMKRMIPVFILIATSLAGCGIFLANRYFASGRRDINSTIERAAALATAIETIADHPLAGVGSWSSDFDAANRHRAIALRMGLRRDAEAHTQLGHSELLQPWTEAGVFAALFFLYFGWRLIQSVRWLLWRPLDRYTCLILFYLLTELWNAAFSPFMGFHRMFMALAVVLCIMLSQEKDVAMRRYESAPPRVRAPYNGPIVQPVWIASE